MSDVIATRHIRKDWPEWVDWPNQKTVSTMCGVRSKPHLCGIPGITKQPVVVDRGAVRAWGWCGRCVKVTWNYYLPPALHVSITDHRIIDLHILARRALAIQYEAILMSRWTTQMQNGQYGNADAIKRDYEDLHREFPDLFLQEQPLTNSPAS